MSNLSEKHELFARLHREDSAAIAALIDLKTEDDMDKVLNKLDTMQTRFDARLDAMDQKIDARFEGFDARLDAMQSGFDARFEGFEKSVDARFGAVHHKLNTLYWFIGGVVGIAVTILRFSS